MLMDPTKDNLATKQALALADQEWGKPKPLDKYFAEMMNAPAAEGQPVHDGRQWFVLQCEPQREKTAAAHLVGRDFKVFLPTETRRRTRNVHTAFGTKVVKDNVTKPIFPSYLFVRLNFQADQARLKFIHSAPGIRGGIHSFLCVNERPAVISDAVMAAVERCSEEGSKPKKAEASFEPGQDVQLLEGPFAYFTAKVEQIMKLEPEERIRVLLTVFGRETKIELSADQLRSL